MFKNKSLNTFLTTSSQGLNNAFLNSPIPIVILEGPDFKISFANETILSLWNTEDNLIGKGLSDIFPQKENLPFVTSLTQVLSTNTSTSVYNSIFYVKENDILREVHCENTCTVIKDESDKIIGALLIINDITEQVRLKKSLESANSSIQNLQNAVTPVKSAGKTSSKKHPAFNNDLETQRAILAAIVNTSDDTILSKTLDGTITSWNKAAERMFGYTEDEVIGKHISILIPPSRLHEEDVILFNIIKGNKIDHFETIRVAKNGKEIPISLSVSPVEDKDGNIIGASKIARDITETVKSQERQAILAAIVNTSDDTILSKSLNGIITSWNLSAQRMFGYTEQEIIGKHVSILIPPAQVFEEEIILSNIIKGNRVNHFETIRLTKEGKEIHVSISVSPIEDAQGNIIGASKIARDITSQKQAEEALKRYTKNLEIIYSMGKSISGELDLNKIIQKVTDETTLLTGAKFGAFFHNNVNDNGVAMMLYSLSGAPKEAFEKFGMPRNTAVFQPTFNGEILRVDDITKDERYGRNKPHNGMPERHLPVVSFLSVPVISKTGEVIGGLFFGHPEAAKFTKEHEDLVTAIASQASIGLDNAKLYEEVKTLNSKKDEFIGLASHELKTPLTSISGYLQILGRTLTDDKNKKFVKKTIQQVNKLTSLVSDLLDVSKIEAGKLQLTKEVFDIKFVLGEAVELIEHSHVHHKISVETNITSLSIFGDPQRIEQVIINLLTNAIKYSPAASEVKVLLSSVNEKIMIGVKDSGIGIPDDMRMNIFSRFFRVEGLSPHMSGLGIGLYLSKEIIERHDGKIWVESELQKGSTFWFSLPIVLSN